MSVSPVTRILQLAAYARDRQQPITLAELMADLPAYDGTSKAAVQRMLHRDLTMLRASFGIHLDWDDATQAYHLQPPFLTRPERSALLTAAAVVAVEGVGDGGGPLGDLGTAIPDETARVVVRVHGRVADLRDPIATRTRVRFRYHGRDRVVEPYAVGEWRNRWYLSGREPESDRRNRYRLDRIEVAAGAERPVEPIGEAGAFTPPADLDPAREFLLDPNLWGHDAPLDARVEVHADHVPGFLREFDGAEAVEDTTTGAAVALTVRHRESFVIRLLGFRGHARVVAPAELVDEVRAWLVPQVEAG